MGMAVTATWVGIMRMTMIMTMSMTVVRRIDVGVTMSSTSMRVTMSTAGV